MHNAKTLLLPGTRSMRNEITAGMSALFGKHWEIGLNWRHIDRISYFDTDAFEVFATLSF